MVLVGTRRPTSVPADDILRMPRNVVSARGHLRQIRPLVLPPDDAAQVDAPCLLGFGLIAERLERDRDFDRPALVEDRRLDVPDRVPVGVRRTFVGDLAVGQAADRIRVEEISVPAIVERIEQHAEGIVLAQLAGVAPHLVGDAPVGSGVPAPRGHVNVVVVKEHPGFGPFCRRPAFVGFLLHEVADRDDRLIDLLVEPAIDADAVGDVHGANRHACAVAGHDGRLLCGARRCGPQDGGPQDGKAQRGARRADRHRRAIVAE